jgi:hypothetical protein
VRAEHSADSMRCDGCGECIADPVESELVDFGDGDAATVMDFCSDECLQHAVARGRLCSGSRAGSAFWCDTVAPRPLSYAQRVAIAVACAFLEFRRDVM